MFVLPLVGWGMLSAARYPIVLYGSVHLPFILPHNAMLYAVLRKAHTILAYLFFLTFLAHFGAILFHTLIVRDGILRRNGAMEDPSAGDCVRRFQNRRFEVRCKSAPFAPGNSIASSILRRSSKPSCCQPNRGTTPDVANVSRDAISERKTYVHFHGRPRQTNRQQQTEKSHVQFYFCQRQARHRSPARSRAQQGHRLHRGGAPGPRPGGAGPGRN